MGVPRVHCWLAILRGSDAEAVAIRARPRLRGQKDMGRNGIMIGRFAPFFSQVFHFCQCQLLDRGCMRRPPQRLPFSVIPQRKHRKALFLCAHGSAIVENHAFLAKFLLKKVCLLSVLRVSAVCLVPSFCCALPRASVVSGSSQTRWHGQKLKKRQRIYRRDAKKRREDTERNKSSKTQKVLKTLDRHKDLLLISSLRSSH
jgi:hypothetical protein